MNANDENVRRPGYPENVVWPNGKPPYALHAPDKSPAPAVYDVDGQRIRPGDKVVFDYGDGERVMARLCLEEVYVLHYFKPTASGTISQMVRHRPQAELTRRNTRRLPAAADLSLQFVRRVQEVIAREAELSVAAREALLGEVSILDARRDTGGE